MLDSMTMRNSAEIDICDYISELPRHNDFPSDTQFMAEDGFLYQGPPGYPSWNNSMRSFTQYNDHAFDIGFECGRTDSLGNGPTDARYTHEFGVDEVGSITVSW